MYQEQTHSPSSLKVVVLSSDDLRNRNDEFAHACVAIPDVSEIPIVVEMSVGALEPTGINYLSGRPVAAKAVTRVSITA